MDFYCPKARLGIELDGNQHNAIFVKIYDKKKTRTIEIHGIKVIHFWNYEVYESLDRVIEIIKNELSN